MNPTIKARIESIRRGEVPEGYKKAKVGIVPEEWNYEKLGKHLIQYHEISKYNNQYPVLTSSRKGIFLQADYYNREVASEDNTGYNVVPRGYFTYRHMSDDEIFKFNINTIVDKGIVSTLYPVFTAKNINNYFLQVLLNEGREFRRYAILQKQGGSRTYMYFDKLKQLKVCLPPLAEQEKIAEILQTQDKVIELQQKKIEELKRLKKVYLSKMFPKKGCNVPEIRFPGFTDPWEQRELGDIADIVGGGTPSTSNSNYWDGDIDWYAPDEIADQIYVNSSQRKITDLGYENSSTKMLPPGTVLFTSRAGIGKTAILTRKGCTNQGFQSIVPHLGELDSYFIFSRTEELKRYGELAGAGSTFVEVSGKQMAAMVIMMPSTMREQQTIGQFFSKIDNLITLHQRKLDEEQKKKKSLMQLLLTGIARV